MDEFDIHIHVAMIVLMLAALGGGLYNRHRLGKGIGQRFIQFVGIAWLIGATVILALMSKLDVGASALLGVLAGYLFGLKRHDE